MRIRITGTTDEVEQVAEILSDLPAVAGGPTLLTNGSADFRPSAKDPATGAAVLDAELSWVCRHCGSQIAAYAPDGPRVWTWVHLITKRPRCVATDGITHAEPGPQDDEEAA
ncbi:hypothetical protein LZ318_31835 [Saccharopolyspora indica]|uniref:hypothetical protein n=1 Tax=Saccharopolyspora indica TaxID=1229659 RepID=UPI0022EA46EA|nr:hypothetical protein [Saccharopolyspora indica]MDA3644172.1 hypothetical protein [Saccharopolyspora indica]